MSNFADWFSKIIVINLARRPDRWAHFQAEMEKIGVRLDQYERFEGYDRPAEAAGYPEAEPEKHYTNENDLSMRKYSCSGPQVENTFFVSLCPKSFNKPNAALFKASSERKRGSFLSKASP